jgi:hypothetical protein
MINQLYKTLIERTKCSDLICPPPNFAEVLLDLQNVKVLTGDPAGTGVPSAVRRSVGFSGTTCQTLL